MQITPKEAEYYLRRAFSKTDNQALNINLTMFDCYLDGLWLKLKRSNSEKAQEQLKVLEETKSLLETIKMSIVIFDFQVDVLNWYKLKCQKQYAELTLLREENKKLKENIK